MPSLSQKALQPPLASHLYSSGLNGDSRSTSMWTRSNTDDVNLSQLHKFWTGLSAVARRELLRIDKQTLFEQVRKNLYCSRCHGLLVEGFSQIVLYGKNLQAGMVGYTNGTGHNSKLLSENGFNPPAANFVDDTKDPSVHPWGGLAATRDSMLTVLDCFLDGMPLEVLQNVFESARARERERELLYPDACGGSGRGWICQNGSFNGRGHGMKETCALHTARLSCEALVDFWSALGDETRRSLLRMKEEDFIERLMFRFDSKRFCRDCRRNVLREFKEMKELKRSRKEPQCTRWFCAADTSFRYEALLSWIKFGGYDRKHVNAKGTVFSEIVTGEEPVVSSRSDTQLSESVQTKWYLSISPPRVKLAATVSQEQVTRVNILLLSRPHVSESSVQVDWRDCFAGDVGSVFQRFEWALGTGEGKCDILGYEDVGLSDSVHVNNLDLASLTACIVTVRGWRRDGRCTELSAKAHALKGQLCVHRRLIVGDGFVSMTKGESIQRFFERAEETEEEEDEDAMDKDGNDFEGEGSRPQKHAKSPELARDFLLDAATVIFKEQVEKAFREGTARQNAHSIFVCLALSLLEERVRVACKEITTLERQNKLLEEEEDEKREEEERRERRKLKEKEKKLRRKEKLKSKEKGHKGNSVAIVSESNGFPLGTSMGNEEERESSSGSQVEGTEGNNSEDSMSARPSSPDMVEARPSADGFESENGGSKQHEPFALAQDIEDALSLRDGNGAFMVERSKSAKRRTQGRKGPITEYSCSADSRRGSTIVTEADSGGRSNAARVAIEEIRVLSPQNHSKIGLYKTETEIGTKRVDSWSRAHSQITHNRHEEYQPCACGSSHTNSRVKGGPRALSRVGVREASLSSHKSFERVGSNDSIVKLSPRFGDFDFGPSVDPSEHLQKRPGTAPSLERKEERTNHLRGSSDNTDKIMKASYGRSASLESSHGISNGYHGLSRGTSNNSAGHGSSENGSGVIVTMKPVWTPRSTRTITSSNFSAGNSSAIASGNHISENSHGKNDRTQIAKARPATHGTPVFQTPSPKTGSGNTSVAVPSLKADIQVSVVSFTSHGGQPSQAVNSKTPTQNFSRNLLEGAQGTSMAVTMSLTATGIPPVASPPPSSTAVPVQSVAAMINPVHENGLITDSCNSTGLGTRLAEGGSVRAARPVHLQGSGSVAPVGVIPSQSLPIDPTMLLTSLPLGTGPTPPPPALVHSNGHPPIGHPMGGLPRQQPKSMYAFSDMRPPQGPVQHSMQLPNLPSSAVHGHPQQSFGYYQVGPWAARGRNGVLPLPQPGGFLVPGPGGLGLTMGVLPPMSLPVPGPLQAAPVGLGVGRLPALPNGLNPIQFREHVFLSRYGGPGRGGLDPRGPVQMIPSMPPNGQVDTSTSTDGAEGHRATGQAVSNGTSSPTFNKDSEQPEPLSTLDISGFSLFHSGWPASGVSNETDTSSQVPEKDSTRVGNVAGCIPEEACRKGGIDEKGIGVAKVSSHSGEYSLFASAPSKGFGFF